MSNTQTTVTPRELYHRVWALIPQTFWFQDRLGSWSDWEHRFDPELMTNADAFRCSTIMLNTLKEMYTEIIDADDVGANDNEKKPACCSASMLSGQIGYIKIATFSHEEAAIQIRQALETIATARAFIVDLRNNTGGFVGQANKALSSFMNEGGTYTLKERKPDQGYFEAVCSITPEGFSETTTYGDKRAETETWARYENVTGDKPMVVLINGRTGSASELFASVLRDCQRATLVGTRSFGKGIAQNTYPVGNGYKLSVTDGVFLPPSGQFFGDHQQTVFDGIVPHIMVPASEVSDDQLSAAIDHLARACA